MKCTLSLILLLSYAPIALSQTIDHYNKYYDSSTRVSRSVLRTTGTEICNNNIDDDNNGLVDDKDFACYFNGLSPATCKQSSILWVASASRELYWVDMSTGVQHIVGTLPIALFDITWASNGKLYGCSIIPNGIWEVDPNTANAQFILPLPLSNDISNSMTADAAGNLYYTGSAPGGEKVFRLNIATRDVCKIAELSAAGLSPAGDLTFLNGKLYLTCMSNLMATIDVRTGKITKQPFNNATTDSYFGLASLGDGFLYVCHLNNIYKVDPATMQVSNTPTITLQGNRTDMFGMASYNELCQAPVCLAKTTIEPSTNPPYCINQGVQLKGLVTPICNNNITAISWTTADGTLVPGDKVKALTPGKYYLHYQTTTETCNRMDSFTLQFAANAPLKVDTAYVLPIGCSCTGTMTVIPGCGSGHFSYQWSTGATTATVNNACPGTYLVKVTDVDWGNDTTIRFYIPPPPTAIQRYDAIVIGDHCNQGDGSINITNIQGGTAPFQYALNNQALGNTPSFAPLPTGNYTVTVKDVTGCILQDQVTIPPVPGPQKLWYTKKDAYCGLLTGTIIIDSVKNGTGPFSFSLNNGAFNQQKTLPNLLPGPGTITIKDNYGCTFNESFTIYQSEQLQITVSPQDTTICASEPITFKVTVLSSNAGVQYIWNQQRSTFRNFLTIPVYADGKMIVEAFDKNGCTAFDSATITAPYCDSLFAKCVLFPNAFSPNRDGLNDTFGPHLSGCEIKSYLMSVYNRWGQLIFQTRDMTQKWNGATNGQSPQTGTYLYTCVWKDAVGYVHKHKGAVVLVR